MRSLREKSSFIIRFFTVQDNFLDIFLLYFLNINNNNKNFKKNKSNYNYITKFCFCQARRTLLIKLFLNNIKNARCALAQWAFYKRKDLCFSIRPHARFIIFKNITFI